MAIDLSEETYLTLAEASHLLPGRPHTTTMWRWMTRGVRGHRLETVVIGGRRFVSHEALHRFITATTAASPGAPSVPAPSARRKRELAAAEVKAAAMGI